MKHKDKIENLKEEKEVEIEKQESSDIIDDNTGTIDEAAAEVEELKTNVDNLQKELDDYKDRLVRKIAEFDNYKRRTENEQNNLIRYSGEIFVKKILPFVDDFERLLKYINSENVELSSTKEGINLVHEKLFKIFDEQGITKINPVGKSFDVHFHEAVMQKDSPDVEPLTVLEEIETGYLYKDRVLRHSKVIVSSENQTENTEQ